MSAENNPATGVTRLLRSVPVAWRRRLVVTLGGAVGTLGRVSVSDLLGTRNGWPLGTLTVNLLGALLLGWVLVRLAAGARPRTISIPLVGIGVLGAFTTFGTFALELWEMLRADHLWMAVAYLVLSVTAGLALAASGARWAARR